jgi:two-component system, response regulator YesN
MWNLIIVDDENLIVEDIKASIDWSKLGISNVFTAFSMRKAKEIFESDKINIMLCDIEMPQGSGLELLSWVREHSPKTESIFLTCHADFSYAKEAVRLGSLDYILKPIPYDELEKAITKAIDKVKRDSQLEEFSRFGEFWFKHQPLLIERFWLDIINLNIPSTPEDIKAAADYRNIPYTNQMKVLPILVGVQQWYKKMSLQDEKIMEYGLKNVAEEMLAKEGQVGQFFQLRNGEVLGIVFLGNESNCYINELEENCKKYIVSCNQYLNCDISCYAGEPVYAHELAAMVNQLILMEKNNVAFYNNVFLFSQQPMLPSTISTTDMSAWEVMIKKGLKDKVISEVEQYLEHLATTTGLNANMLYQFQQNFVQMLYKVLEHKGIQANQLLDDSQSLELQIQSVHSVIETAKWIQGLLAKVDEYTAEQRKSEMVVKKVKDYIRLNLDQELTREQISTYVYLNADYLDRVFKKETGVSVTKYMMEERLKVACELLSKTEISISEIAAAVGYTSLSTFSSMFKKMSSMSPAGYRRASRKTEKNKN